MCCVPNNGKDRDTIQPGDIRYKDINGDGIVNVYDQTIIGNPNPKHIGGFNNYFQYKNLDFSIYFQWSYGGDILNANRIVFEAGLRHVSHLTCSPHLQTGGLLRIRQILCIVQVDRDLPHIRTEYLKMVHFSV